MPEGPDLLFELPALGEGPASTFDVAPLTTAPVVVATEKLVFDGLNINNGTDYGLLEFQIPIPEKNPEWIEGSDISGAVLARTPLVSNGNATVVLDVIGTTRASVDGKIRALISKLQQAEREPGGLPLVWQGKNRDTEMEFTVLAGTVAELPLTHQWIEGLRPTVTLSLQCEPYGCGPETTTSAVTLTGTVGSMTIADVPGDAPADATLTLTDLSGQPRRFVEVGCESDFYNAAAPVVVDSTSFVTTGYAGTAGTTTNQAPGGLHVVSAGTVPEFPTALFSTGPLSHAGTFKLKAGVLATPGVLIRAAWRAGEQRYTTGDWIEPPVTGRWSEVTLGTVHMPPPTTGSQTWNVRIDARNPNGTVAGADINVDYLLVLPITNGYGVARTPVAFDDNVGALVNFDNFQHPAGALAGRPLSVTGTWSGAGSGTGFTAITEDDVALYQVAQSAARGTFASGGRRYELAGTGTYTDVAVSLTAYLPNSGTSTGGALARYVNTSNWIAGVLHRSSAGEWELRAVMSVAGAEEVLGAVPYRGIALTLTVFSTGHWMIGHYSTLLSGYEPALATGGALASGRVGIMDEGDSNGLYRNYRQFGVNSVTAPPVVIHPNRRLVLGPDSVLSENPAGGSYGRPPYLGAHFTLMHAGDKDRVNRIVVRHDRNDLETSASVRNFTDQLRAQVTYRPKYYGLS